MKKKTKTPKTPKTEVVYETTWRNKFLTMKAKSIGEMADILSESAIYLKKMEADGILLDDDGVGDDYACLYTSDPKIAKKYGLHKREEY